MSESEKPKKARRSRVDSQQEQVAAMSHAHREIDPPADMAGDMDELDHILFQEVIDEAPKISWTPHAVRIAAMLARTIRDMLDDQKELRDEGSVISNDRGNFIMNPRRNACQGYASQIMALRRSLALHATAGGRTQDVGKRRQHQKNAQAAAPEDDDDLIPMAPVTPASGRPLN